MPKELMTQKLRLLPSTRHHAETKIFLTEATRVERAKRSWREMPQIFLTPLTRVDHANPNKYSSSSLPTSQAGRCTSVYGPSSCHRQRSDDSHSTSLVLKSLYLPRSGLLRFHVHQSHHKYYV